MAELSGDDITRFINLCAAEKLSVFNIHKKNDKLYAGVYLSSLKRLINLARGLGLEVGIIKEYGIPVFLQKYRKRVGAVLGIIIFALVIFGTQNFIWTVDASGNSSITNEQLLSAVSDAGVGFGTLKRKVNYENIKTYLMTRFDNISWVAVNIIGTKLHIIINEGDKAPEIHSNTDEPCNIVAKKDGIITDMVVHMGQKEVKPGDVVVAGDLLVNGIMEDKHGNCLYRKASAKIYARTEFTKQFVVNLAVKQRGRIVERGSLYSLKLGQTIFPLFHKNNDAPYSTEKISSAALFGITLPVELYSKNYFEYEESDVMMSEHNAIKIAGYLREIYEKDKLRNAQILSRKEKITKKDGRIIYSVDYICNENIAKSEKIYFNSQKK